MSGAVPRGVVRARAAAVAGVVAAPVADARKQAVLAELHVAGVVVLCGAGMLSISTTSAEGSTCRRRQQESRDAVPRRVRRRRTRSRLHHV